MQSALRAGRRPAASAAGADMRAPRTGLAWLRVANFGYRYELRRGVEVVATGHFFLDRLVEVGEPLEIGGREGIVRAVEPLIGQGERRLVVQLVRASE